MKKVIVTGAAGFLGSHLCDELLEKGYYVYGFDNFFRGKPSYVPVHKNFKFFNIDLTEKISVNIDGDIDMIYHYAAINGTEYFYDIPLQVLDDNIKMIQNILEYSKEINVKKIIYTSSSEVYGDNPPIPTNESEKIILNVDTNRDSYASSKALGEFYIKLFCKKYNIDYLILRPFNTYGPRMDNTKFGQVIPEFIRKLQDPIFTIIGEGSSTRSFCHVDDHKKLAVMLSEDVSNDIVNIGQDDEISIINLASTIHLLSEKEFKPEFSTDREYDTKRRCPDISKIRNLYPDYKFIDLEEGLKKELLK